MAAAVLIRVSYLVLYYHLPDWSQLTVDNWYHLHWAMDIAGGNIFGDTTYFRAPLYVFCLAPLFAAFGQSLLVARLFGLAVGVGSVYVTFRLGARLFGRKAGLVAAALHAVYPIALYFEAELLLDPLFTLLFEIALYRLVAWAEQPGRRNVLILGGCIGLASICRPTALVLVPVVMFAALVFRKIADRWHQIGLLVVGVIVFVGAVFLRNVLVAGDPVPVSAQGGINLYIGNNDVADGYSAVMPEPFGRNWQISQITYVAETDGQSSVEPQRLTPGEVSDYWTNRALSWMLDHPSRTVTLYATKLYAQILDREISNNRDLHAFFSTHPLLAVNPIGFGIVFALAICGAVATLPWRRSVSLLVVCGLLYALAVSLFFFNSRFRLPLLPLWFVFAGTGLTTLVTRTMKRRISALLLIGLGVAAAIVSYIPATSLPVGASTDRFVSEGLYEYSRGNYRQALTSFRKAQEVDPAAPDIHLNIGAAFLRMGFGDSARAYFVQERALHPLRPQASENLASLALLGGDPSQAMQFATHASELAPYRTEGWVLQLRAIARDGAIIDKPGHVVATLDSARTCVTDSLPVLSQAALALAGIGNFLDAVPLLHNASDAEPPPIETDDEAFRPNFTHSPKAYAKQKGVVWYQLGYIDGLQGRYGESVEYSRKAIRADSLLAEAYANLVTGNLSLGHIDTADSVLADALRRFPNHPQLLRLRQAMQQHR